MDWPLGEQESLTAEFKRADALKDPANIAREVVALLNAEGGEIWIGVGETAGVADVIEAVPNPEQQRDRLQDALVDLVEPSPIIGRELEIEVVPFPADQTRGLVRVRVSPGRGGPYALLRQTARAYLKRTGSRLRSMTREEIADAFRGASGVADREQQRIETATQKLEADLYAISARLARDGGMRVIVRTAGDDVELALKRDELLPLLQEPSRTGNRPLGWNFTSSYSELVPLAGEGYRFGEIGSVQWLEISPRGDIDFNTVLERLHWRGEKDRLWPFALLEFPISVARLARVLYANSATKTVPVDAKILLGLGLFRISRMTLSPHSPHSIAYQFADRARKIETDDFVTAVLVSWAELHESPDRCAYHLVRQVYRAFGFEEDEMPAEYNRDTGQLTFPR